MKKNRWEKIVELTEVDIVGFIDVKINVSVREAFDIAAFDKAIADIATVIAEAIRDAEANRRLRELEETEESE